MPPSCASQVQVSQGSLLVPVLAPPSGDSSLLVYLPWPHPETAGWDMNFGALLELECLSCASEYNYCICHSYDSLRSDPDARYGVGGLGEGTHLPTCTPLLVGGETLQTKMLTGVYGTCMHNCDCSWAGIISLPPMEN